MKPNWISELLLVPGVAPGLVLLLVEGLPWYLRTCRAAWVRPGAPVPAWSADIWPKRGSHFAAQMALATLEAQGTQSDHVDGKLGLLTSVSATLLAVLPTLAAGQAPAKDWSSTETAFLTSALIAYAWALLVGLNGIWVRSYKGMPELDPVRKQFLNPHFSEANVEWASITSILTAVSENELAIRRKLAKFRILASTLVAGVGLTLAFAVSSFLGK